MATSKELAKTMRVISGDTDIHTSSTSWDWFVSSQPYAHIVNSSEPVSTDTLFGNKQFSEKFQHTALEFLIAYRSMLGILRISYFSWMQPISGFRCYNILYGRRLV